MKPYLFLFLLVFFSSTFILAAEPSLGTFKQYDCINLIQICDNCSYNNISSVVSPSSSILLSNVEMSSYNSQFNYTFCSTTETGIYKVNGYGDLNGVRTVWVYDFEITPSGQVQQSIFNNPFIFIIVGLGFLLLIFAVQKEIGWLGFISSVLFLLGGIYIMIYGFNDVTNLYTRGVALVVLGIGIIIMIVSAYEYIAPGDDI